MESLDQFVFRNDGQGTCRDHLLSVRVGAHRKAYHSDARMESLDLGGGDDAVEPWHVNVHDDDVGAEPRNGSEGVLPVNGLPDDVYRRIGSQEGPDVLTKQRMVVDQEDSNGRRSFVRHG